MAFLTALILLTGGITASAEDFDILDDSEEGEKEAYLYTGPDYDPDTLVIGNPTPLSGNFTTQMWGYNTSDVDVTALVNGYNLIRWDHAYNYYEADASVVNSLNVIEKDESQEGGLNEDLKYSDGTPITAADYAFSILLNTSPEARLLGGNTDNYAALFGVEEYRSGSTKQFAGVRILNEHTLSLTVKKEYLPFFYELGYLRCYPMPIHVIAPGCTVTDDGQGAYIDGTFNYVLLEFTLLDPAFGYVSHPAVVSGPYKLLSYDEETHTAAFEINPEYLGNYEGQKDVE